MFKRNLTREAYRTKRQEECGGFYELTRAQVAPIFTRVTRLPEAGFSEVRPGWWARPVGTETFQVLHFLRNPRGFDYRFRWGISLPWVPRVAGAKLRWHRTLKSAEFDLWEQPFDLLIGTATSWQEADAFFPDRSLGESCFEEDLVACWSRLGATIESWWSSATDPRDILAKAQEQVIRIWEGPRHAPDPLLVVAFTLAHLGMVAEGKDQLMSAFEYEADGLLLERALEHVGRSAT